MSSCNQLWCVWQTQTSVYSSLIREDAKSFKRSKKSKSYQELYPWSRGTWKRKTTDCEWSELLNRPSQTSQGGAALINDRPCGMKVAFPREGGCCNKGEKKTPWKFGGRLRMATQESCCLQKRCGGIIISISWILTICQVCGWSYNNFMSRYNYSLHF